jgi:hypothetical protein
MNSNELATKYADLYAAAESFREMGRAHNDAAGSVEGVSTAAFHRPDILGCPSTADSWSTLRDQASGFLRANAASLVDTGTALEQVCSTFEKTDSAAATEYALLKKDIDTGNEGVPK